jgi:hypothetical protein
MLTFVSSHRSGFEERPDDYKLKDSKGKIVLCFGCNRSSGGNRIIITCDHCQAHWHLDCLDPPLANPPCRDSQTGAKNSDWMCPLHTEHDLRRIDTERLGRHQREFPPRAIHYRIPKHMKNSDSIVRREQVGSGNGPTQTILSRGHVNNGIIEVDSDSDDDDEFYDEDAQGFGKIPKLPREGIKLDFIQRVKQ